MPEVRVLVTGANGRTGRPIVAALNERGLKVRAFIRDSKQESALKEVGASECVVGDMEDLTTIKAALKGCDKVVHIGPPAHPNEVEITKTFVQESINEHVDQFVYYSVMHPLRRDVRHHRLKLDTEQALIESGLPYTILQPMRYMQHLDPIWKTVKEKGIHKMPFNTEVKFNVVDLLDLADATATVCEQSGHLYATYELAGPESLSQSDMAQILTEELGRPVTAEALSMDQLRENGRKNGWSEDRTEQIVIMNEHYDHHGFLGNANVLTWLLERQPSTYRQYVQRLIRQD